MIRDEAYEIRSLKEYEYKGRDDITDIVIFDCEVIPNGCFEDCSNLKTVLVHGRIKDIRYGAFQNCTSLYEITMVEDKETHAPEELTVGTYAFFHCYNLRIVDFFEKVTHIYSYAFSGCKSLEKVHLGRNLKTLRKSAFYDCGALDIVIKGNSNFYHKQDFIIEKHVSRDKQVDYNALYYLGDKKEVALPREVTVLSDLCFKSKDIRKLSLSPSLLALDESVFPFVFPNDEFVMSEIGFIGDKSYGIPDDGTNYLFDHFHECHSLSAFAVQKENARFSIIKGVLFSKDKKILVKVPPGSEGVYVIPEGTVEISDFAFSGCRKINKVMIPSSLEKIGFAAFRESGIETIEVSKNNPVFFKENHLLCERTGEVCEIIFCEKSVGTIFLNSKTAVIREYAFENCARLQSCIFNDGIQWIGEHSFSNCVSLENVALPSALEFVAPCMFENCKSLQKIVFPPSVKAVEKNCFLVALRILHSNSILLMSLYQIRCMRIWMGKSDLFLGKSLSPKDITTCFTTITLPPMRLKILCIIGWMRSAQSMQSMTKVFRIHSLRCPRL